jgi:phage terminase small subunit
MSNRNTLTPKEKRFVEEYLIDFNQTKAVIRAGYDAKNNNVAHVIAQRLLRKPTVQEYLDELQVELAARNEIDRDFFVLRLKSMIEKEDTAHDY